MLSFSKTRNENIILILCENLLYGISDTSTIKFIKRLDYVPMCFCSFVAGWYYGMFFFVNNVAISNTLKCSNNFS